jgi:redox-sensitive bicupin YhaK (pirin superfamily)
MGNSGIIKAGDVQRMSAGTGIFHSEVNPSNKELYLYQIWIFPKEKNVTPSYEQTRFEDSEKKNTLRLIASENGADGSVTIGQDAKVFASMPERGTSMTYQIKSDRGIWLQAVSGSLIVNNITLTAGDAAAITDETELAISANEDSHFLLFDLN